MTPRDSIEISAHENGLERVLADLLDALACGDAVDLPAWQARYPAFTAELEELCAAHREFREVLGREETPRASRCGAATPPRQPDAHAVAFGILGDYELLEELGRGGMGRVYKARQLSLGRLVAIKLVRLDGSDRDSDRLRFRTEGEAIARLDHPNIVPVYEVGEHQGQPYLANRYVEGGSLSGQIDRFRDHPQAAAGLVATLARALHHAHERGVLHRDLKPGNVLLEWPDGRDGVPVPHVADFGLARLLDQDSALTQTGDLVGTPSYMAPEQARGGTAAITTATDIYGLGAILYALLTGRPPFAGANVLDTLAQVKEREPVEPRRLNPRVSRDLETICLKCLRKEPGKRYASALDLAEDLRRLATQEPILARPVALSERVVLWTRRRPALAALYVLAGFALVALIGAWWYAAALSSDANTARQERDRLEADASAARPHLYAREIALLADPANEGRLIESQLLAVGPAELRGFEWRYLQRLTQTNPAGTEWFVGRGHTRRVHRVAFSPDGRLCVSAGLDGKIIVWEPATCNQRCLASLEQPVNALALSADGRILASGSGSWLAGRVSLKLWDVAAGTELASFSVPGTRPIAGLAFAPDGQTLASCGESPDHRTNQVLLWDLRSGRWRELACQEPAWCMAPAFAPDGHTLAVGCGYGQGNFPGDAAAPRWGAIRLFDLTTGKCKSTLTGHTAVVQSAAFSADGKTLFSGDAAGKVKVWDVSTRETRLTIHAGVNLAVSANGSTMATVGGGNELFLWDAATGHRFGNVGNVPSVHGMQFGPTGTELAVACDDATVRLFDTRNIHDLPGHRPAEAWSVAFAPDGKTLASSGDDHTIRIWSVPGFKVQAELRGHTSVIASVVFSPDGLTLASGAFDRSVRLWDVATGREKAVLRGHTQDVRVVAFSRDGRWLATAAKLVNQNLGELKLWDVFTGQERMAFAAHGSCVAFSVDGLLAFRDDNNSMQIVDLSTLQATQSIPDLHSVNCVAFAPDGKTLATGDTDGVVKLWDVKTACERQRLHPLAAGEVRALSFSADGMTVASACADKTIHLWHAATGIELLRLKQLPDYAHALSFSPDGVILAAACHDGTVRIYRAGREP